MEKEDLQKIIEKMEDELLWYQDRIDFFQDLLQRDALAGKNKAEAEMDILDWQEAVKQIESDIHFFNLLMKS